jgi:hypothetical protein
MKKHRVAPKKPAAPQIALNSLAATPSDGATPYSLYIDGQTGQVTSTQYSNKPITATDKKTLVINETRIFAPNVMPLSVKNLREAYVVAINRYYPLRQPLYDIYEDCIATDGHLKGIISKRFDKILNKPLYFKKNNKIDKEVSALVNTTAFRSMCREMLSAQLWGITGYEFVPGKKFDARMIPRKHIKTKWQIVSFEQTGNVGVDYTKCANLYIIGEPEDLGCLLQCSLYSIYKRNAIGDWAKYLQIFGQPIRVMHYDAHDQQTKIELAKTLKESGGALEMMIPIGVEFDIKDGKESNGDGKLQETFVNAMDKSNSVVILGNVETTTSSQHGTNAKAQTQKEEQDDITKNDLFYLTAALNNAHFLNILSDYGYNIEGGQFEHSQEISIAYLAERIKIDIAMPESLPIEDDYWYNTYGIEKPANYKTLKAALEEKQKQIQQANTIEADPKNVPAKNKGQKPQAQSSRRSSPLSPLRPSAPKPSQLRNLINLVNDFFA